MSETATPLPLENTTVAAGPVTITNDPEPIPAELVIGAPEPESGALVSIKKGQAIDLFTKPENLRKVLVRVAELARAHTPDMTTAAGRKAVASNAYKVAQTKTYLDGIGKTLVDEMKELPKKVDAGRRELKDFLDSIRDEVRVDLTTWEAEQARQIAAVEAIKNRPAELAQATAAQIEAALAELEAVTINPDWHNATDAQVILLETRVAVRGLLKARRQYDADQAELARLREEERIRKEEAEKERLRKEGEERARVALVAKAKQDHILDLIATSSTRREAMAKAADGFVDRTSGEVIAILEDMLATPAFHALPLEAPVPAVELEPEPQALVPDSPCAPPAPAVPASPMETEVLRAAGEAKATAEELDREHRRAFNREALADLAAQGTANYAIAEAVLRAIVAGKVRHVSITY